MSALLQDRLSQNWFFKYKLYHIPFWCLYHYLWWTVAIANPIKAASSIFFSPYSVKYIFYVVFEAAAVYFNLYYLIPRFLENKKLVTYTSLLATTIIACALCIVGGYYLSTAITGKNLQQLYGNGSNCFFFFLGYALPSAFASMTLAMTIKLIRSRLEAERKQELAEKEKLETELRFLKHQFNPHFLFNSINSIFFLIHKNPDMASESLAQFSELLRHQLYECNDGQISLHKEITYLQNYIDLEKLRNKHLTVNVDIQEHFDCRLAIAPFILMTFVENAFKHVSRKTGSTNYIDISLSTTDQHMVMKVINTTSTVKSDKVAAYGGIGLNNAKRRLDLIYPGEYTLSIQPNSGNYEVVLEINLEHLSSPKVKELPELETA